MEHTNKNAVKILASEYSDYWKNTWHYDRQYNMLCRMEKAVLPQANVSGSLPSDSECEILAEIVRKHLYDAGTRDIRIEISWKGIRRVIKKWNEIQARQ